MTYPRPASASAPGNSEENKRLSLNHKKLASRDSHEESSHKDVEEPESPAVHVVAVGVLVAVTAGHHLGTELRSGGFFDEISLSG